MTLTENAQRPQRAALRELLTRDHERLERLFDALPAAFEADAREDAARLWGELDGGLSSHMAFEEREVLPAFRAADPREADALLAEHGQIRRSLVELGIGVDLHLLRAEVVSEFIELLRSHARREDALLYRWAERELPELSPPFAPVAVPRSVRVEAHELSEV